MALCYMGKEVDDTFYNDKVLESVYMDGKEVFNLSSTYTLIDTDKIHEHINSYMKEHELYRNYSIYIHETTEYDDNFILFNYCNSINSKYPAALYYNVRDYNNAFSTEHQYLYAEYTKVNRVYYDTFDNLFRNFAFHINNVNVYYYFNYFNTSKINSANGMFQDSSTDSFRLYSNNKINSIIYADNMFRNCYIGWYMDIHNCIDFNKLYYADSMFRNVDMRGSNMGLSKIILNVSSIYYASDMFADIRYDITDITGRGFLDFMPKMIGSIPSLSTIHGMFRNSSIPYITKDILKLDARHSYQSLFNRCEKLHYDNISELDDFLNFDTGNDIVLTDTFRGCVNLDKLQDSNIFGMGYNFRSLSNAFRECSNFNKNCKNWALNLNFNIHKNYGSMDNAFAATKLSNVILYTDEYYYRNMQFCFQGSDITKNIIFNGNNAIPGFTNMTGCFGYYANAYSPRFNIFFEGNSYNIPNYSSQLNNYINNIKGLFLGDDIYRNYGIQKPWIPNSSRLGYSNIYIKDRRVFDWFTNFDILNNVVGSIVSWPNGYNYVAPYQEVTKYISFGNHHIGTCLIDAYVYVNDLKLNFIHYMPLITDEEDESM